MSVGPVGREEGVSALDPPAFIGCEQELETWPGRWWRPQELESTGLQQRASKGRETADYWARLAWARQGIRRAGSLPAPPMAQACDRKAFVTWPSHKISRNHSVIL